MFERVDVDENGGVANSGLSGMAGSCMYMSESFFGCHSSSLSIQYTRLQRTLCL